MALTGRFDADFQPFLDAVQQANKSLDGLDASAKELNTSIERVSAGSSWVARITEADLLRDAINYALDALKELAAYFPELAERGSVVGDVADAFDHLTEAAGLTANVLLGDLRAGTHGTVDDFELMKRANENMAAGLNLTEDQFKTLSEAAFALAKATGTDVTSALNTMSDAMITGHAKGLQLLTGKIDLKKAEQDYADSLEGTGRQLTAEGKLEVDRQAMLTAVGTALDRLGPQQDSLQDKIQQAHKDWNNFQDDLGQVIAKSPVLATGLDTLRTSLIKAFGGDQETAIKNIASQVNNAAIVVADFGMAVEVTARISHMAWDLVATGILGAMTIVSGAADIVMTRITGMAGAANALSSHIVSDDTVRALKDAQVQVQAITASLAAQTAEAARGVIGQSDFDKTMIKLGTSLADTRAAMVTAQAAMAAHTDAAKKNSDAVDKAADSQKKQNDQVVPGTEYTKKFVDAWAQLNQMGTDYQATVDAMNPKLVEQIQYYLKLGASVKLAADAFPAASETQIAAIDAIQKKSIEASTSITKIWNEYTDVVGTGSQTAYQKAEAAIDKWYADDLAKHQAAKTDTAAYYDAIAALDDAKYAALAKNRIADDKDSKLHLENQAAADQEAYQFALQNQDQFSQQHIQKLRDTADASALAAARWGTAFEDAATTAGAAVDKLTGAIDAVTSSLHALGQTGDLAEQQALSSVMKTVDASGIGQMMKMGTTNVNTMNAYEAAIAQGMAALGYQVQPRASGGPVSAGTPYMVGEAGPELFVPSSGGAIVPNAGGMAVTLNITQPLGTPSQIAAAVSSALADAMRRYGVRLPSQ